jgi:D-glycero-alpha-D-manno-heptose-7-phosphate kinase
MWGLKEWLVEKMSKKVDFFIQFKAPLRIGFLGGGTDIPDFYNEHGGHCITASIKKYVYTTLKSLDITHGINYRLSYSMTENVNKLSEIKNDIARKIFEEHEVEPGIHLVTQSDLPSSSGLGSSSAFCVSLASCMHRLKGVDLSKPETAENACQIEIHGLGKPIGKQDQYAAAIGGINSFRFSKNNLVTIQAFPCRSPFFQNLQNSSVLVWTGKTRNADRILADVKKHLGNRSQYLKKIYDLANLVNKKFFVEKNLSIDEFGQIIAESWRYKMELSDSINDETVRNKEEVITRYPFFGHKLLGAGGGGFFLAIGPIDVVRDFIDRERELICFQPTFDTEGVRLMSG